jgi:hypothetical protein
MTVNQQPKRVNQGTERRASVNVNTKQPNTQHHRSHQPNEINNNEATETSQLLLTEPCATMRIHQRNRRSMTETHTQPNSHPTSSNPLTEAAPKGVEADSHVPAQNIEAGEDGVGFDGSCPVEPAGGTVNGAGEPTVTDEPTGSEAPTGAGQVQRSRKRSTRRLEELQRRQADLVKPEKKTEPIPGTRLEPSLNARWEAAVQSSGLSSSALVYVAVVEYLESVEQRSILGQMQGVARLVADTGNALLGSMEEVRARLRALDSLAGQLKEAVAQQEAKFVTADDVEGMLVRILNGADEEPGADELEETPE